MENNPAPGTLYRDQDAWREQQQFLPEHLRFQDEADKPVEEFWNWRGNAVRLDHYPNPDAPAKNILLHDVGTNGR